MSPRKKSKIISTDNKVFLEKKQMASQLSSYNKSYCRTQYTSNTVECNWEIVDFWKLYKFMKRFISVPFPKEAEHQIQIEIRIFSMSGDLSEDMIGFHILTNVEFTCYYSICQIGPKGEEILQLDSAFLNNSMLLYTTKISTLMENSFANLLKMNFKFDIFSNLLNTIAVHTNSLSFSTAKDLESKKSTLDNDPKFDNKESITFIINGKDYNVSKNILCATNSSYFKFLCNTKDDITDKLIITDKPDVFKEMLSFIIINDSISKLDLYIWEQRICNSEKTIEDLLIIANKYDVRNLKFLCEQLLLQDITVENALGLLQVAMQTDAKSLKKCVASFIKFHIKYLRNKEFLSLPEDQMNKLTEMINSIEVLKYSI